MGGSLPTRSAMKPVPPRWLPAAAIDRERVTAVLGADRVQAGGDLGERRLPRDCLVRAVEAAAKRRRQAVGVVTVPLQALRLLAEVSLRARVRAIAAHPGYLAPLRCDLEAAVHINRGCRTFASTPPWILPALEVLAILAADG